MPRVSQVSEQKPHFMLQSLTMTRCSGFQAGWALGPRWTAMDWLKLNGPCGAVGPILQVHSCRPAPLLSPISKQRGGYMSYTPGIMVCGTVSSTMVGAALNSRWLKFNIPFSKQPGFGPLASTAGFKSCLCQLSNSIILHQLLSFSES